jgi:hypothetical protein
LNVEPALVPVRIADMKFRAGSSAVLRALSNAKLAAAGFVMPSWQEALARYIHDTKDR